MCGRSSLTKTERELEHRFRVKFYREGLQMYEPLPNYNVAPTHVMPIVCNKYPDEFRPMRWGLLPFWAKDIRIGAKMINARIESVLEKSAFKQAVAQRRCLVPMDGYYEWKKHGGQKTPYRIKLRDQEIFAAAGLWATWKSPEGEWIKSFTILTQEPSPAIAHIHDRMPAILQRDQEAAWLDMNIPPTDALAMLAPYPDDLLHAYVVSARVGKVTENDEGLIDPVEAGEQEGQQALF